MTMKKAVIFAALFASLANAQDPPEGWMAYAVGSVPSGTERITHLEMKWKVGENPKSSSAFFSPWFGMDPADNLNLIQPWSPTHNSNSASHSVKSGQTLHGVLDYDESSDSYTLSQTIVETGTTSTQTVKCQNGKKYTVPYVVYEKTFPCKDYPPDEKVTFTDIVIECDGKDCTDNVKWESKVKDSNCEMKANILSQKEISITWSTSAESRFDNMTRAMLHDMNYNGWATKLNITRPLD